jgi:hypothetical protein
MTICVRIDVLGMLAIGCLLNCAILHGRGVVRMDLRERVRQLQREIVELSEESKEYRNHHSHTAQDKRAHQMREKLLQKTINELMRLAIPKP